MNSKHEFATSNCRVSNSQLDHLKELGLEFFPETDKYNNELKNGDLESILLNGESDNYSVSSPVEDSFHTFDDYVPHDMPSLSPSQQDTELIEVFPVINSVVLGTDVDGSSSKKKKTILLSTLNDVSEQPSIQRRKAVLAVGDIPAGKKYKIRRLVKKSKLKAKKIRTEVSNSAKHSHTGNNTLNGFDGASNRNDVLLKNYNDNTELDNKINSTLLDMLQAKTGVDQVITTDFFRLTEKKVEKDGLRFITIFPSKPHGKIINLMVKGKSCRSKQPLTESELRMVTKILAHENNSLEENGESSYKNVYYDAELDTNIRYEVNYEAASEETLNKQIINGNPQIKKSKFRAGDGEQNGSTKNGYVLNSVARTRCGRISRPPRHVIRDYKRLKQLNEPNNDVDDETENGAGYADYGMNDDSNSITTVKNNAPKTEILYGPLEPSKRQFSSLSRCPSCDKIYLGYRRMALHFQKYPEHKNEELLRRLLIRNKKRALEENNSPNHTTVDEISMSVDALKEPQGQTNGVLKKKGHLHRKIRMRGLKNKSHLKELLSSCCTEDIIKYAAPMVAKVLNSWEYLLLRAQKMKTNQQTLVDALLKEISGVLKKLRSFSRTLVKPYEEKKENSSNLFTVDNGDVLGYVLDIAPGKYLTSKDEDWAKEHSDLNTKVKKVDLKDEYAALCSSTVNSDEDPSDLLDSQSSNTQRNDTAASFYRIVGQESPATFTVVDLVHNMGKDTSHSPTTTSTANHNEHIAYTGNFSNLKDNVLISEPIHSADDGTRLDYIPQTFSPSHTLNFDSLVDSVDSDIINAFPISLPMLSDNSTDSKDYGDILNSLKNMDSNDKSVMTDLSNIESSQIDLLNSLKNIDDGKSIINGLRNTISCDLPETNQIDLLSSLKNMGKSRKPNVNNLETSMLCSSPETNQVDLLNSLNSVDGSDKTVIIDLDSSTQNKLSRSNETAIHELDAFESMDFTSRNFID